MTTVPNLTIEHVPTQSQIQTGPAYRSSILPQSVARLREQLAQQGGGGPSQVSGVPEEGDDDAASLNRTMERTFSTTQRDSRRFSSMFTRSFAARIPPEGRMGSVLDFGATSVPTLQVQIAAMNLGKPC